MRLRLWTSNRIHAAAVYVVHTAGKRHAHTVDEPQWAAYGTWLYEDMFIRIQEEWFDPNPRDCRLIIECRVGFAWFEVFNWDSVFVVRSYRYGSQWISHLFGLVALYRIGLRWMADQA